MVFLTSTPNTKTCAAKQTRQVVQEVQSLGEGEATAGGQPGCFAGETLHRHKHYTRAAPTSRNSGYQLHATTFYSKNPALEKAKKAVSKGWPKLKCQAGHYVKSTG